MIDAYIITDKPEEVSAFLRERGGHDEGSTCHGVALIVNPAAGGGRAARALPAVEARLRELGIGFERRRHARPRPRARAGARRGAARALVVTLSGDGISARRRRAARGPGRGRSACCPAGAATTSRACVGIPLDRRGGCDVIADGVARARSTSAPAGERTFIGIASLGFDSEANRIANAAPARLGRLVYALRRAARAGRLEAGRVHRRRRRRAVRLLGLERRRGQLQGLRRRHVPGPRRRAGRRRARRRPTRAHEQGAASCQGCRRSSRASTSNEPSVHVLRGAEVRVDADRPSWSTPTATRSASCRSPCAPCPARCRCCCRRAAALSALGVKVAAARAAGALSRRAGRGGTSLPGKVLHAPGARTRSRAWARACERGSAVISATNGKTTTAAMVAGDPRARAARGSSTTAPARTWPAAWPGAACEGPRDGDTGLFEVDEFWLGQVVAELRPRALLLANLFRDQLDRYGELDTIADRWAEVAATHLGRARAQRRRPAPSPISGATAARRTSASQDDAMALAQMQHAADAKHCRRCGAPYRYDAVYLGHLGRYHCDACGATRPEPQVAAAEIVLEGVARRALHAAHAAAASARIALPAARPLQRLQRARRRRAGAGAGRDARRRRRRPAGRLPRLRARRDAARRRARAVDPAGQEPGRRQRGPAHADARGRRARRPRRAQRQHRRRARRQLGLGRRLRGPRAARAPGDVQRHARGRDGAAAEVRGRARRAHRRRARARRRPRPRAARRRRAALRPAHLHRDARAARAARGPRRRARGRSR